MVLQKSFQSHNSVEATPMCVVEKAPGAPPPREHHMLQEQVIIFTPTLGKTIWGLGTPPRSAQHSYLPHIYVGPNTKCMDPHKNVL